MTIWKPVIADIEDHLVEWKTTIGRAEVTIWWSDNIYYASMIATFGGHSSRHQTKLKGVASMHSAKIVAERWANGKR